MPSFIAKQPNGLYCRFSTVVDCLTHINMTKEESIKMYIRMKREEIIEDFDNMVKPFEWVVDHFCPNNMTEEEFYDLLKEVGWNQTDKK